MATKRCNFGGYDEKNIFIGGPNSNEKPAAQQARELDEAVVREELARTIDDEPFVLTSFGPHGINALQGAHRRESAYRTAEAIMARFTVVPKQVKP